MTDDNSELREQLAALCHQRWSGWMRYLFAKTTRNSHTGDMWIHIGDANRWQRQMATPYAELTEAEQQSDRAEADRILELVRASLTAVSEELKQPRHRNDCASWSSAMTQFDELFCNCGIKQAKDAEAKLAEVSRRLAQVTSVLESIANSSCCSCCQEAVLVAKSGLEKQR